MFLFLKWPLFEPFFLGNIGNENVFHDILAQKKAFLGYKNRKFKKSKNYHLSKGVNPWFRSKNGHFSKQFFLGNIGQENVFYNILEQKNACLGYRNKEFKMSKNWHFSKGVKPWFCQKMAIIRTFFFVAYSSGKVLLRYCTTKKRRCRLWKQEV